MSVERGNNPSLQERQDLIRQTFDAFKGKSSPENFINFASQFNSGKIDYHLTVESFLRTKGWENATDGNIFAVEFSRHLVVMILPQYNNEQSIEQKKTFNPLNALTPDTDVDLAKGIALIAKGIHLTQKGNKWGGLNDCYRAATYIESSTAAPELKMQAFEFYTRAVQALN